MVMYKSLLDNQISTNFEHNLYGERWFIRIGTAEITRRGMKEKEMTVIAQLIDRAMKGENVKKEVVLLNNQFSTIQYSFD